MLKFHVWQKWLYGVGLLLTVFGLVIALFNHTSLFNYLFRAQIDPVFWQNGPVTPEAARFQQWIYGVLGATISGWGICVAFIAHFPFRNRERWAWNAFALGITVWFVTDTAVSLYFGVTFNAVFNMMVFAAVWLPLIFSRRFFTG